MVVKSKLCELVLSVLSATNEDMTQVELVRNLRTYYKKREGEGYNEFSTRSTRSSNG